MEENIDIQKHFLKSFSQERRLKKNSNDKLIFNKFKTNVKKTPNINFNKSIYNRVRNININDNFNVNETNINLKDYMNNKFIFQSQKLEKPIKIKKEQNAKILPVLQNDKKDNIIESLTAKKFLKLKKMKNLKKTTNKSFFSVDKVKIKKPSAKKFIQKKLEIIRLGEGDSTKYINTLNSKMGVGTSTVKKKQKKYSPIISSNSTNLTKRRGYSNFA